MNADVALPHCGITVDIEQALNRPERMAGGEAMPERMAKKQYALSGGYGQTGNMEDNRVTDKLQKATDNRENDKL